jgi:threonine 3-dehydrogenase
MRRESMRILLTGAGGQIGRDLIAELGRRAPSGKPPTIVATDLKPHAATTDGAGVHWRKLDVTDEGAVRSLFEDVRPDLVIHLAAILSASGEKNPQLAYAVNQTGTWNVLEAARTTGTKRFVFTSSIAVYGPGLPDPTPDDVPLHPQTIYGCTKVAGELLCEYYTRRGWLDCRGVRFPGLISASLPGGGSSDYALFMYTEGVRTGAYEAFCRPDTRIPLMYMPDGVRALAEVADAPREQLTRCIYNVAAFSPRADEIAASVKRALPDVEITYKAEPVRQAILDSWPRALDDQAARKDWGWQPEYDLDAMTDDLVPRVRELLARGVDLAAH